MPVPSGFSEMFQNYLLQARTAKAENRHHDYRRALFLDFVQGAFGFEAHEVEVEKFLKIDIRQHGWVDALFRDLVFEFKRDMERERADGLRELTDYLRTLPYGAESVGLLTDGVQFEAYVLDGSYLRQTDALDLGKTDDEMAFLWLDSYLFSQKHVVPTSADIVRRYGAQSPTFQAAARVLGMMLDQLTGTAALDVKRKQWRGLLAKVYGSDIGGDDLFIRHTFLNQFAKLLAYAALRGIPRDDDVLADIISGEAFHAFGVSNLGEIDFFAWILSDEVMDDAVAMLRRLAQSLVVYDLARINEDLLKQLYQNLVDPETRHDLGEYYTPDWLAELVLQEIDYHPGQSLLDPSCGSGTFLFMAIRRLASLGLTGWDLVDFALENIAGVDVHPLAVTVARINYLLAVIPHMRGARARGGMGLVPLPVYMADSLLMPEETGTHKDTLIVSVDRDRGELFHIPTSAAQAPTVFSEVIDLMENYAQRPEEEINMGLAQAFADVVSSRFSAAERGYGTDLSPSYWLRNLRLLNRLIHEDRNSIWAYMLKNIARPLLLAAQKFDVIVGNPPWLSYRFIRDKVYQDEVKGLTLRYGLLESGDVKLFTQMDLSTLFMVHCELNYLRENGTIAFVMPRSVITGAKQHRPFQARGVTRVIDLLRVSPLFNIPSCVIVKRPNELHTDDVPTVVYEARLPAHQMSLGDAQHYMATSNTATQFVGETAVASPYYYERVKQGATLVPRNLCFVRPRQQLQPGDAAVNPAMESDPDVDTEAKAPWKGVRLEGLVSASYLYTTFLSKNLVPFGCRRLHLVALPVRMHTEDSLQVMGEYDFLTAGDIHSWKTWFQVAESKWDELKKGTSQLENLIDQYDYQGKLTAQKLAGTYKLLYTASGVHLAACVLDVTGTSPRVFGYPTQGFVADTTTYCFDTYSLEEAHYLCALLNAPCVDHAIKDFQARGKGVVGQRHIHRTPFESCPILPFDQENPDHLELARLSREAHAIVASTELTGGVVKARRMARAAVDTYIQAIDVIACRLLRL
ncbi:MAG: N-6 DNA methylase [Chloroflexi bacterium]|nr:N-6 DNA methylase [Chloroflexota bacterium]